MKRLWGTTALMLFLGCSAGPAAPYEDIWHGWSNSHGGVMEYSYDPRSWESAELKRLKITCYALDKSIRLVIYSRAPDNFHVSQGIRFHVDDEQPVSFDAEIAFWGYWGPMPSTWINADLLEKMMKGGQLDIKLESDPDFAYFRAHLTGTQNLFARHLKACLD